jgi:hypothetical protein
MSHKTIPQVRIKFSWLLYEYVSRDKYKLYGKEWGDIPAYEQCEKWTENYRQEWTKYEDRIIPALTTALGVSFRQPIIDASVAPGIRAMSDPLILNFMYYPDQFVDSLTHELIHVLLTDSDKFSLKGDTHGIDLIDAWRKLYGEHDFETMVHIPVHAIHKYIYLDVFKEPERLRQDIKTVAADGSSYANAWRYVEAHDYRQMVEELRRFYAELAQHRTAVFT